MRSIVVFTLIFWSGVFEHTVNAQIRDGWNDSIYMLYPFLNYQNNTLSEGSTEALSVWFQHLQGLIAGTEHQLRVLHIGDSHIQADFFPGTARILLQGQFGNSGRGFIFPYSMAKSHNAKDVFVHAQGTWSWSRSASNLHAGPAGISGYGLSTQDSSAGIKISVRSGDMDYRFNRLSVFEQPNGHSYTLNVSPHDGTEWCTNTLQLPYGEQKVFLETYTDSLSLSYKKDYSSQTDAAFYGISLENDKPGILYHSAGQNGAYVRSFLNSTHFLPQVQALNPDLIVISVGTNDAFVQNNSLCHSCFRNDYLQLIRALKNAQPNAAILLSTPPDFFLKRKYVCRDIRGMAETIHQLAKEEGCAVWDLYEVMGAEGSILDWKAAGLAGSDMVHFSETGYRLQGFLMYEAMMDAFEQFLQQ